MITDSMVFFKPSLTRRQVQKSAARMAQTSVLLREQDEKYRDLRPECKFFVIFMAQKESQILTQIETILLKGLGASIS